MGCENLAYLQYIENKCKLNILRFTLTDALVTTQTINLLMPGSELQKRDEWKTQTFRTENLVSHY